MKFQVSVDRLMPLGTRRRYFWALVLTSIDTIRHEGWYGFARRVRIWLRLRHAARGRRSPLPKFRLVQSMAEADALVFPEPSRQPEVSIIVAAYSNWSYTLTCLKSIRENAEGDYEVVVVDDASSDETPDMLSKVRNIGLIRNEENVGFLESCNRGAQAARGRHLLFLNNDTIVAGNWLTSLLAIGGRGDVGAVGSKLIYPNGILQEAGGIIWNTGSCLSYGWGDDSEKPEYNYVRDVDYCSAASLMAKRELFEEIGGFDTRFERGYYEDSDFCLSLRDRGYRVLYQPASVVVHFGGMKCRADESFGGSRSQEVNRSKFVDKWNDTLKKCHYCPSPGNILRARDRRVGKSILVIDRNVPTYDRDAGSLRMFSMLKILSELGHKVTFLGDEPVPMEPYTAQLQQEGIEVVFSPYVRSIESHVRQNGTHFDVVILSRAHIAIKYVDIVRESCPQAKVIFDTVDLEFLREYRRAKVENSDRLLRHAQELKMSELYVAQNSALTLVVSQLEKDLLLQEAPSLNVEVVSNMHHITKLERAFSERRDILFIGAFDHLPNVDAVTYFVKEILPLIRESLPDVRLYIAGSNPPRQVLSLRSDDIIVTGYVGDLTPYFESCKLSVAPLRYGAGVKGKINQSMSYGLPVVTTSIGAEGLEAIDGEDILIADSPADFAQKVILLYSDEYLWRRLSENSIRNIEKYHSYDAAKAKLGKLLER
ncbi:MAG: glycosyltransferase [Dehalococcoidia bacterium]